MWVITREVLRDQPMDIIAYCALLTRKLITLRFRTGHDPVKSGVHVNELYYHRSAENLPAVGFTVNEEEAARKIQSSYRLYRSRKNSENNEDESFIDRRKRKMTPYTPAKLVDTDESEVALGSVDNPNRNLDNRTESSASSKRVTLQKSTTFDRYLDSLGDHTSEEKISSKPASRATSTDSTKRIPGQKSITFDKSLESTDTTSGGTVAVDDPNRNLDRQSKSSSSTRTTSGGTVAVDDSNRNLDGQTKSSSSKRMGSLKRSITFEASVDRPEEDPAEKQAWEYRSQTALKKSQSQEIGDKRSSTSSTNVETKLKSQSTPAISSQSRLAKTKTSPKTQSQQSFDIDLTDKEVQDAARKIQSQFRAHLVKSNTVGPDAKSRPTSTSEIKKSVAARMHSVDYVDPQLHEAATKIQSGIRGYLIRHQRRAAKSETKNDQKLAMNLDRTKSELFKAAVTIQANYRGYMARRGSKTENAGTGASSRTKVAPKASDEKSGSGPSSRTKVTSKTSDEKSGSSPSSRTKVTPKASDETGENPKTE